MRNGTVMPRPLLRLAFVLFTTGFISIIILADRGQAGSLWAFLGLIPGGDKLGHLGLVGTLSLLLNLLLESRRAPFPCNRIMLGSLILLAAMTLEEASQALIPHRNFDRLDGLANIVGVFCGEGLVRMLPVRHPRSPATN